MYFIMRVPMQRLIIPDLWILLSGLFWSWYRIHCRRSLYFCAWMIRWYLNLAQNLKMFQNCLTMPHTTVPTIWMDTALWVSCSAYLSGMGIKYIIFPFLLAIVYGRKKSLNWNWQPPWSGRLCLNFTAKIMSSSFVTAGILCHFREKYRNTYKIKCYNKGLKTDDSLTSLSFIKL